MSYKENIFTSSLSSKEILKTIFHNSKEKNHFWSNIKALREIARIYLCLFSYVFQNFQLILIFIHLFLRITWEKYLPGIDMNLLSHWTVRNHASYFFKKIHICCMKHSFIWSSRYVLGTQFEEKVIKKFERKKLKRKKIGLNKIQ